MKTEQFVQYAKADQLKLFFASLTSVITLFLNAACAEDMTITTYYPSPNGTYDALSVKRLSVGDTNADGSINASDVSATSGYLLVADKLGIGVASPAYILDVKGDLGFGVRDSNSQLVFQADPSLGDNVNLIQFYSPSSSGRYDRYTWYVNENTGWVPQKTLSLWQYPSDSLGGCCHWHASFGIDASGNNYQAFSGNVGIGTAAPGTRLHVYGNGGWNDGFRTEYSGGGGNGWNIVDGTDNNLYIGYGISSAPSVRMVLQNGGNVGIGTASPGGKLDVYATATTWGGWYEAIRLSQSAHSAITHPGGGLLFGLHGNRNFYWADTTNEWYAMTLNANGALTIRGAASLAGDLTVTNGIFRSGTRSNFFLALQGDRNVVVYDNGGAIWASGTSTSDKKLKKNITVLDNVLEKLKRINGVRFNWINKDWGTQPEIGVIAQEVEKEFPELVWTDPKSGDKLVKYEKLTPVLIEAIKEQQRQIDYLTQEIAELRRRK